MMENRFGLMMVFGLLLPFVAGCGTYLQQRTDLLAGGPERRVQEAQQLQQAELDKQQGLLGDKAALEEELESQEAEFAKLDERLQAHREGIARARAANKLTRAQEEKMREEIRSMDRDIRELEFQLQSAQLSRDSDQEELIREQLRELAKKMTTLDEEIELLSH